MEDLNTVLIIFVWNYMAKQTCILKYYGILHNHNIVYINCQCIK